MRHVWLLHTATAFSLDYGSSWTDRRAVRTRADGDCSSTSKAATASCGWSDKTLQCKNVNDQGCAAFGGRIYI